MQWHGRTVKLPFLALVFILAIASAWVTSAQGHRFGPDDSFVVRGQDIDEIGTTPFRVDPSGSVTLPLIGNIHAAGLTVGELEAEINGRLKKFIKNPAVSVTVAEVHSHPISVFGAVNSSAVYQAQGAKNIVEVIAMAGGLRNDASNTLTVTRMVENGSLPLAGAQLDPSEKFWVAKVDLAKLMTGERPQDNIQLQPNDVLSVEKAALVYVIGDVNRAGAIPLVGRLTVTQALAKSEGLQRTAERKKIRILREVSGDPTPSEIPVDFTKVLNGTAKDPELQANDIIVIPNDMSRAVAVRTLEAMLQIGTGLIIWGR